MLMFRVRDFVSVIFYKLFCRFFFKEFGKNVRIVFPLRIIGSKYISFHNNTTLQYNGLIIVVNELNKSPELIIKSGTLIGNFSHIVCSKRIIIDENVLIADKVFISDNVHGFDKIGIPVISQKLVQLSEVVIGKNSWIGENVSIIGASVGQNSIIGSNSVVTKDIGDYTIAVGSPAKAIKRYCFNTNKWKKIDSNLNFID